MLERDKMFSKLRSFRISEIYVKLHWTSGFPDGLLNDP